MKKLSESKCHTALTDKENLKLDPRFEKVADVIVDHSTKIQRGDKVLIRVCDLEDFGFVEMLIRKIKEKNAEPYLVAKTENHNKHLLNGSPDKVISAFANFEQLVANQMNASIAIMGASHNALSRAIDASRNTAYKKLWHKPVYYDRIVAKTRWVLLNYPTKAKATEFGMDYDEFVEFWLKVMTVDYAKMAKGATALQEVLRKTDIVEIFGPTVKLRFSVKDIPSESCCGTYNLPDGEVFTAPVKNSIEGTVTFNAPTEYDGENFKYVNLKFEKGKIISAECGENKTKRLNEILNTDEGARYCGEFAFGLNPDILEPVGNTLFDEKIAGSFHLTPGACYDEVPNGNESAIHWDMVLIQRMQYGGGEIYFDGVLIRKNGRFVLPELKALNPENLI